MRARILRETGDYISECLRHPELAVRIPAAKATEAHWTREFADAFWQHVLPEQ